MFYKQRQISVRFKTTRFRNQQKNKKNKPGRLNQRWIIGSYSFSIFLDSDLNEISGFVVNVNLKLSSVWLIVKRICLRNAIKHFFLTGFTTILTLIPQKKLKLLLLLGTTDPFLLEGNIKVNGNTSKANSP